MQVVQYHYTISLIIMTLSLKSGKYTVNSKKSAILNGIPYTLISMVLGWWGFPWGPIKTIKSIFTNFSGGEVIGDLEMRKQTEEYYSRFDGAVFKDKN